MSWLSSLKEILGFGVSPLRVDYSVITSGKRVPVEEKKELNISEPILTFIKTVEENPNRFNLYKIKDETTQHTRVRIYGIQHYQNTERTYILTDTLLNKNYLFCNEGHFESENEIFPTKVYKGEGFKITGEDLSWVTWDEWESLQILFSKAIKKRARIAHKKTRREEANQRRRMRKLYETN